MSSLGSQHSPTLSTLFVLWVQKVGSKGLDPPLQPSEHLHSSVLLKLNASSGVGL